MNNPLTFLNGMVYMALILVSLYAYDLHRSISQRVSQQVAFMQDEDYVSALTKGRK